MSFSTYFQDINTQISLIVLVSTCMFTWTKGGPAERLGAVLVVVSWLGTDFARAAAGLTIPASVMFLSDLLLSLGFLYVSVRYSSLWLGLAMLFESFCFALHALQLDDTDAPRWHGMIVYLLLNNILNYLVLLTLAGGTLATMGKRAQARKTQALAQAKAAGHTTRQFTVPQPPLANSV